MQISSASAKDGIETNKKTIVRAIIACCLFVDSKCNSLVKEGEVAIANTIIPLPIRCKKPLKNIEKTSQKGLTQSQATSQNTICIALGWPVESRSLARNPTG